MSDEVHGEMPPMTGQPALYISQGAYTDPEVRLVSGSRTYRLDGLVHGMICMGEAMALAIEAFDHPTKPQVMQARRALEHAIWLLEEARIQ